MVLWRWRGKDLWRLDIGWEQKLEEVQWSDVWQKGAREAKGEDVQNSGEASIAV